jgi:DNA-binding response OmpR family regulator
MDAFKIMIIEDDEKVRGLEAETLGRWGYEVFAPEPRGDMLAAFVRERPHLVVLDIGLPYLDGFEWCSRMREISRTPILFLTARTAPSDQVRALAGGGDDWLSKPFDGEVFVAKVRALLRRSYAWSSEAAPLLEHGDLVFDVERNTASRAGKKVELSKNEASLLKRLLERDGRVASRDELMDALWSEDEFVDDNTLTVNMTRLKKALAEIGAEGMIETVRGLGYRMP